MNLPAMENLGRLGPLALLSCLILSACASAPAPRTIVIQPPPRVSAPACAGCGRVTRIETIAGVRATPQGHAVLSGVVGGVLAGPAKPQSGTLNAASAPIHSAYRLTLHMADGRRLFVHQNSIPVGVRVGSLVRLSAGRVVPLR